MPRPIVFDITHLRYRAPFRAPTGIDRVDLAFGRHFASARNVQACVQYAWNYPRVREPSRLDDILRKLEARWGERSPLEQDVKFQETRKWIVGIRPTASRSAARRRGRRRGTTDDGARREGT